MGVFDSVEERLWLFMGLLRSGSGIWSWCFSEEGTLYYTSCQREKEFLTMFHISGCMEYALRQAEGGQKPFVVSNAMGMLWFGEYFAVRGEKRFMIAGPVFAGDTQMEQIEKALRRYQLSVQTQRRIFRVIEDIPVVDMRTLASYVKMLHYAVTLEEQPDGKILYPNIGEAGQNREKGGKEEPAEVNGEQPKKEGLDLTKGEGLEEALLRCVREGNRNYGRAFVQKLSGNISGEKNGEQDRGKEFSTASREAKNEVIILTALCARAATEGGCPKKETERLQRYYLRRVEETGTLTGLMQLNLEMLESFIDSVRKGRRYPGASPLVRNCYLYIEEHLTEELTLERIASEIGYAPYYLSRKFYEETGLRLWEYIREERLGYAQVWLETSNKSIQQICEELHFGGRSYFSRAFKKKTGLSPAEYRKRVKK